MVVGGSKVASGSQWVAVMATAVVVVAVVTSYRTGKEGRPMADTTDTDGKDAPQGITRYTNSKRAEERMNKLEDPGWLPGD